MGLFSGILDTVSKFAEPIGTFFGGPLGGALSSAAGALYQNQQAKSAAGTMMDFQRDMRETSYQAAVKDMQAAGLNPAMMYASGGGGAAVPTGAMPQTANPIPSEFLNSAVSLVGLNQQNKAIEAQIRNTDADTLLKLTDHLWRPDVIKSDIDLKKSQSRKAATSSLVDIDTLDQIQSAIKKMAADTELSHASAEQVRSQNLAVKKLSELGEYGEIAAAVLQALGSSRIPIPIGGKAKRIPSITSRTKK